MVRGKTRNVPNQEKIPKIDVKINASIHNRFDIEVVDSKTGEVKQRAQAENVICNNYYAYINTYPYPLTNIAYGSGSGTPSVTDNTLFTYVGHADSNTAGNTLRDFSRSAEGIFSVRKCIVLSETTAVGVTISEVGFGNSTRIYTHAMLQDMNGNPITILKTSTDIINIYATVFVHYAQNGYLEDSIQIIAYNNNTTIPYTLAEGGPPISHPTFLQYANDIAGATGDQTTCSPVWNATTRTWTITLGRLAVGVCNLETGIAKIDFNYTVRYGYLNYALSLFCDNILGWYKGSTIVGEAIDTGDGIKKDFATKFPFVSSSKVYVDGVETACTVNEKVPFLPTNMGKFFHIVSGYSTAYVNSDGYFLPPYDASNGGFGGIGVWYNPYYAKGITSFVIGANTKVEVSNNLTLWATICDGAGGVYTKDVPAEYQNYKYWRISKDKANTFTSANITTTNIHFAAAPASGAVITADYTTAVIAKDVNHVFDFSMTIQLGDYIA